MAHTSWRLISHGVSLVFQSSEGPYKEGSINVQMSLCTQCGSIGSTQMSTPALLQALPYQQWCAPTILLPGLLLLALREKKLAINHNNNYRKKELGWLPGLLVNFQIKEMFSKSIFKEHTWQDVLPWMKWMVFVKRKTNARTAKFKGCPLWAPPAPRVSPVASTLTFCV